jgi:hypothetical protein
MGRTIRVCAPTPQRGPMETFKTSRRSLRLGKVKAFRTLRNFI